MFTALEKLTEVKFVYSPELIGASRQVSIDVQDKELQKVLSELLAPLDLRFEMVNNYVILSRKKRVAGAAAGGYAGCTAGFRYQFD
ncbi:MAG: STN domain-containing protein [Bacteroidetes bacterium]|nr:STN domain-containing protein [Bacteroidota bacterium]